MSLEPAVIWQGGKCSCKGTDKWFPREFEVSSGNGQNLCVNIKLKRNPPNCKRFVVIQKRRRKDMIEFPNNWICVWHRLTCEIRADQRPQQFMLAGFLTHGTMLQYRSTFLPFQSISPPFRNKSESSYWVACSHSSGNLRPNESVSDMLADSRLIAVIFISPELTGDHAPTML